MPNDWAEYAWKFFAGLSAIFYALLRRTKRPERVERYDCHKEIRELKGDLGALEERMDRLQGSVARMLREGQHRD